VHLIEIDRQLDLPAGQSESVGFQEHGASADDHVRVGIGGVIPGSGDVSFLMHVGRNVAAPAGKWHMPATCRFSMPSWLGQRRDQSVRGATKAPAGMGPLCPSQARTSSSLAR